MPRPTKFQQIADKLRRRIESREWPADKALPTEAELMAEYEASRNTVREAVKLLVSKHLLETKPGLGTFVTQEIVPFVTRLSTDPKTGLGGGGEEGQTYPNLVGEQGRQAGAEPPEVTVLRCPPKIAARLRMDESMRVVSRHQQRRIDETTWSLQTSYYPLAWVHKGAERLLEDEDIPEGAVEYLKAAIGLVQVGYRDLISSRLANEREQDLFNLTHSHTVIEVYRTSFAKDLTPIRVTVTVYPSDRNQLVYDAGQVSERWEEPVQF